MRLIRIVTDAPWFCNSFSFSTAAGSKAAVLLCCAAEAQTYAPVADWLELPSGRTTLGPMHGDIAVSKTGDVYVSVETQGMGVEVFSPDGRYPRSLASSTAE
jgi:hypothetical protein